MKRALVFNDYENTPGEIKDGQWKFPTIMSVNNRTGKDREWTIYIAADVPFQKSWLSSNYCNVQKIYYYTVSGQVGGKLTTSAPTYVDAGKVKRNIVQQAISEAYRDWRKQKENSAESQFLRPQLLTAMKTDVSGELYIQYKYNGVRCTVKYIDGKVVLYSRKLKEYNLPVMAAHLAPIFRLYPDVAIDGELYFHGLHLQVITGIVSTQDIKKLSADELKIRDNLYFYIFDAIINVDTEYRRRKELLDEIFAMGLDSHLVNVPTLKYNGTLTVANGLELMSAANRIGIEGIIVRLGAGNYRESINNYHSTNVLKLKPVMSAEFTIIGFADGQGKNAEAIQWICQIPAELEEEGLAGGKTFNVVPAMSYNEKIKLFNDLSANPELFETQYKGRPLTVEYDEISADGIPLRIRAIGIRFD